MSQDGRSLRNCLSGGGIGGKGFFAPVARQPPLSGNTTSAVAAALSLDSGQGEGSEMDGETESMRTMTQQSHSCARYMSRNGAGELMVGDASYGPHGRGARVTYTI